MYMYLQNTYLHSWLFKYRDLHVCLQDTGAIVHASGLCLDKGDQGNGGEVTVEACTGAGSQKWEFEHYLDLWLKERKYGWVYHVQQNMWCDSAKIRVKGYLNGRYFWLDWTSLMQSAAHTGLHSRSITLMKTCQTASQLSGNSQMDVLCSFIIIVCCEYFSMFITRALSNHTKVLTAAFLQFCQYWSKQCRCCKLFVWWNAFNQYLRKGLKEIFMASCLSCWFYWQSLVKFGQLTVTVNTKTTEP